MCLGSNFYMAPALHAHMSESKHMDTSLLLPEDTDQDPQSPTKVPNPSLQSANTTLPGL